MISNLGVQFGIKCQNKQIQETVTSVWFLQTALPRCQDRVASGVNPEYYRLLE